MKGANDMDRSIPGTTMKFTESARVSAFSLVAPVLDATGGLTLSQLSKLTGLEGSTIQNWIKRGWVSTTKGKKYNQQQVLRILLINILRGAMKLDDIAKLMEYVNGDVEDLSDDIIDEQTLYDIFCRIVFTAEDAGAFDPESVKQLIETELALSAHSVRSDIDKLKNAMFIMVLAYRNAYLKQEMEAAFAGIMKG